MCDGCNDFFRSKRGVIRAAAAAQASRFVLVDDLICDIYYRTPGHHFFSYIQNRDGVFRFIWRIPADLQSH